MASRIAFILRAPFNNKYTIYVYFFFTKPDYISGGELFTHLYQRTNFTEDEARIYIAEIIIAIEHLHKVRLLHIMAVYLFLPVSSAAVRKFRVVLVVYKSKTRSISKYHIDFRCHSACWKIYTNISQLWMFNSRNWHWFVWTHPILLLFRLLRPRTFIFKRKMLVIFCLFNTMILQIILKVFIVLFHSWA